MQLELIARTVAERCIEFDRAMLKRWPDAELRVAVQAIEDGRHDGVRVQVPGNVLPVMLRAIAEEVARRGWLTA